MVNSKLTKREEIIFLLRGFFATPIISGLSKNGIIDDILNGKFKINKKKYNHKLLEYSLDYLCDIGLLKKIKNNYKPTLLGKRIFKRQGSFVLLHSYHDYMNNFSRALLDKKITSECDRLENVIGSGQVHGRKFFQKGIEGINKVFGKIDTHIDVGCGNGEYLSLLNNKVKNKQLIGIDFSKISVSETLIKLKDKKKNNNSINAFQANAFDLGFISKKLNKLQINKNSNILFTFWFILHENKNDSFVNYFKLIKKHYKNSKILICEINKVSSKTLVNNKLNTLMPEYFHFHNISNQNLFSKDLLKNNLKDSNLKIYNEINFDNYRYAKKETGSVYIYYAA